MDEFIVQLLAQLDTSKVIKDYNTLKQQLEKQINIKVNLDTSGQKDISKLVEQIQTALSKASNGKLNIDTTQIISALNEVSKNAQQTGQQIGDAVNKGVENSVQKATNALKSFSELKIGTGNIDAVINEKGLLDVERSLDRIKEKYSEFGQVRITDKLFDSEGNLQQFRVNIQQLNGDLKESRSFMMALASSGKSFGFPEDVIKGSESYVHHLNDAKKATNEVLTEEEKLANIMADVREKTEQTRQSEEKRQQLAQSNAINKSLEQEYLQRQKISEQLSSKANKIQLSIETGGYESKVESLITKTQQWTDINGEARISTDTLSTALENLKAASTALSNNNTVENQKALIVAEKELDTQIKTVTNSVKSMNAAYMKSSAVDNLRQKVQQFYDLNGKSHFNWGSDLKRIMNELGQGMEVPITKGKQLEQEFIQIQNAARQAGKLGKTWFQTLREGMSSFSYWTSSTFLVMKAIQSVKSGISTVKSLDTALVDLKKTTIMTASELEDFYYASNKVAKQMGVTTEEIINQGSAWSRLGFSSEAMATKMAKYSSMFASISPGLDLDSATDGLVSTMKAFSIGLDNADDVVDGIMSKINVIGNSKALNNSDIVDFLTRSSSALASANNSIEESIAMGEAIVEITRDAAGAGQVMKTTSMRIRGYDEDVEAYTEELENLKGEIADLTKTAKTPGGISLFTDDTKETYKSTYKILEEIFGIWDDLTDKNQAQLLEVLAGKRNGQALAALISNFKSAQESMDLMANSAGNAEAEMSVIMDKQSCPYVQKCA